MTVGSLFSGIGGLDLGLERAGMEIRWQVEIDEFCCKVLEKHWPGVKRYGDIRELRGTELEPVDLICGGFPCQPFSIAGKRRGKEDDRYLWPEMLRIIKAVKPAWVLGENVANIVNMALDQVLFDLENEGYTCQAFIIPACAVNAPHRRDRVWIVAYNPDGGDRDKGQVEKMAGGENSESTGICANVAYASRDLLYRSGSTGAERGNEPSNSHGDSGQAIRYPSSERLPDWAGGEVEQPSPLTEFERPGGREIERDFRGVAYGLSHRMDRLRALGNAVVPQIAEWIGRRIMEAEIRKEA